MTENNYKAYHGLGMAYHRIGDDEQAVRNIRHSLSLKQDSRAYNDLGIIFMERMQYKDAEGLFVQGLKLKPGNAKMLNNLGAALASQGDYRKAIVQFEEAIKIDHRYENAWNNLKKAQAALSGPIT